MGFFLFGYFINRHGSRAEGAGRFVLGWGHAVESGRDDPTRRVFEVED